MNSHTPETSPTPGSETLPPSKLKRLGGYVVKFAVPAAFSALLVVWMFHKINFHAALVAAREGVEWRWIICMTLFTVLSHIIRGYRWGMQLDAAGVKCRLSDLCAAVFGNYALNLVVPRIGEVWRSVFISRRMKAPFSKVFGTVLGDRLVDGLTVVGLITLTLLVTSGPLDTFIHHYHLERDAEDLVRAPMAWCAVALLVGGICILTRLSKHCKKAADIDRWVTKLWQGLKVLATIRRKWLFLLLTLGIWICYFMQVYVCFFAFPFTRALVTETGSDYGLTAALVAFVFSTLSMAIPSNGGLGPWNIAIIFGLSLFDIPATEGAAFSIVVWSAQSAMLILLGIITAIYIAATSHSVNLTRPTHHEDGQGLRGA